jgi:cytochrome c oxidase cbb3-type subunit 3
MSAEEYKGTVHEYDGIIEHDNHLPSWWLMMLFGAIVFAVGYWFYFHTFQVEPGLHGTYVQQWDAREQARLAKEAAQPLDDKVFVARSQDADAVARGKTTFSSTCAACHGQSGEGLVGPNLTDAFWVHGSKPLDIYKTVSDGVIAKGMPPWKATLGDGATRDVVAYVLTLKGRNLTGPRPAEGMDDAGQPPAAAPTPPPAAPAPATPAPATP